MNERLCSPPQPSHSRGGRNAYSMLRYAQKNRATLHERGASVWRKPVAVFDQPSLQVLLFGQPVTVNPDAHPVNIANPMTNRIVERRAKTDRRNTVAVGVLEIQDDTGVRALVWPLAAVLVLLIVLAGTLLWHQQEERLQGQIDYHLGDISDAFYSIQSQQISAMGTLLDIITTDPALHEALRTRNRERLLALSLGTIERLREKDDIGLLHFHDQDRYTLLQVHAPEQFGDRIDRRTLREAGRTGEKAGGLEIGSSGIPMLRAVKPVWSDGKIIGFAELARNAETLLKQLHREDNVEIAFSIHKKLLKREAWENSMQTGGKRHDWDRFPGDVIAYSSVEPSPENLLKPHLGKYDIRDHNQRFETPDGGRLWRTAFTQVIDASGNDIGDLTVMLDVTDLQKTFRRTMASASVLVIALMIFSLYILLKKTDQRILAQQRERYHARLMRDLAAHREKIREGERTSIAREVHDQLGQCLTGLRLEANLFKRSLGPEQPELMQRIQSMIGIIDTTLDTVRNITAALRPMVLDMGLIPAAEWLLSDTARRAGLECHFDAGDINECQLSDEQATALFRILQEALTNIIRHARATQVRVSIKMLGVLLMRIEDDGVGFETGIEKHREGKSFGLIGMRERAIMIGGDLRIDSGPGEGTVISVRIPCNKH